MPDQYSSLPILPSWKVLFGLLGVFFAATFLVYGYSLKSEFVRWDDGMLVYENPAIREISPATLKHIFTTYDPELYIPLTFFTYQVNYAMGGQSPFVYHFTNLVLHTFNAALVGVLVFFLGRKGWMGIGAGLLFALHPLHTEAVEWVSARKDVLSTFFFLLSIVGYLRWRDADDRKVYWGSIFAFALGLMSKVMVITLPVVLLLLDWREGRKWWSKESLMEKIPYFAFSLIFGLIGVFGKTGVLQSSSTMGKMLMAFKSAAFYLQKMVMPTRLSLLYPYIKPITFSSPDFFVPVIVILALLGLAWYAQRWTRDILFGLLFYLVTVAPTFLNFAKGGELDVYFASDRYAYVPSIGILIAIAWILSRVAGGDDGRVQRVRTRIIEIFGALVIALFAFLSYRQSFVWRDTEALFRNVIRYYPESSHVAHNNLGNAYRLKGNLEAAIEELKQAIAIKPTAKAMSNLGAVYIKQGKLSEARQEFQEALKHTPQSKEAHFGLGLAYTKQGLYADAEEEFQEAARIDPQYEEAFTNLGATYVAEGKMADAIAAYRTAIQINPFFPDAHYNLAVALSEVKNFDAAIMEYETVTRLAPAFVPARINLGLALYSAGKREEARRQFEEVLRIDPVNAAAASVLRQMR